MMTSWSAVPGVGTPGLAMIVGLSPKQANSVGTGVLRLVDVPSPSWPNWFLPQQRISSSSSSAHVYW